ncbi:DNA polymerase III subunit gamma/tau [Microbacterium sp.]|uniref:DNA polymerase III subunit gamma/tau n=1 Tax=Microbacterium sp. TaxID=51671 RepID=UPI003A8A5FC1
MSTARDDPLSWDGDDDPTLQTSSAVADDEEAAPDPEPPATADDRASASAPAEPALPEGFTAVGKGSEKVGRIRSDGIVVPAGEPTPMGNVALIGTGILGGVYALFTIGWIVGGLRLQDVAFFLISPVAYVPAFWLAVLAPAIWFLTTWLLTRGSAVWVRFTWLVAGALLLVPWPFAMIGALGQ